MGIFMKPPFAASVGIEVYNQLTEWTEEEEEQRAVKSVDSMGGI